MISHNHKCIFVHIPKTGGSSVEKLIWPNESDKNEKNLFGGFIAPNKNKYQTGGLQHLLASQIRTEIGQAKFSEYYKFAFVRNPWDKTVSQFLYTKRKKFLLKYLKLKPSSNFHSYLESIQKIKHVQWEPQKNFVFDRNNEQLVDDIFRFEDFEKEMESVVTKLDIVLAVENNGGIPHEKKSTREHYSSYYDDESRELVGEIFRADIEKFDYKFD